MWWFRNRSKNSRTSPPDLFHSGGLVLERVEGHLKWFVTARNSHSKTRDYVRLLYGPWYYADTKEEVPRAETEELDKAWNRWMAFGVEPPVTDPDE